MHSDEKAKHSLWINQNIPSAMMWGDKKCLRENKVSSGQGWAELSWAAYWNSKVNSGGCNMAHWNLKEADCGAHTFKSHTNSSVICYKSHSSLCKINRHFKDGRCFLVILLSGFWFTTKQELFFILVHCSVIFKVLKAAQSCRFTVCLLSSLIHLGILI